MKPKTKTQIAKELKKRVKPINFIHNKKHSEETKNKISSKLKGKPTWNKNKKVNTNNYENYGMKGKHHSKQTIEKMKISLSGRNHYNYGKHLSKEHKAKLSSSAINYIKNSLWSLSPRIGKYEKIIIDEIENKLGFKIIRGFKVNHYWIDGYCKELNLALEIDEEHHYDIEGHLKEWDIIRQKEIEKELNCDFLRIRVNEYFKDLKQAIKAHDK